VTLESQITETTTRRAAYVAAEAAILTGQSYSIGNRSLTRADLAEVRAAIKDLTAELTALNGGNTFRIHRVVPRDNC
jgi:peptidase E